MAEEREARRRRIAERGSDRMALITGRIQTLSAPPPSPSSSPSSSSIKSSTSDPSLLPPIPTSDRTTHFRHKTEGDLPAKPSMEHTSSSKFSRGNAFNYRTKSELKLPKVDTNISKMPAPNTELNNEERPPIFTPKAPKLSSFNKNGKQINLFTAKEINSCIVATESTRVFCSVVIALLVVLSNLNLPLSIVKSTSTIASRPLYILLLSDVTIVVLKLLQKRRDLGKTEEDERLVQLNDGPNWVGAIQILEIGLVFYQTIRGLFIDISCYTVVVICGLCLV